MNNSTNLASAALLFLETASVCLNNSQYDRLQDAVCLALGPEITEIMLMQKINKGVTKIVIKHIYDTAKGITFIRIIRNITSITLYGAKHHWDMLCEGKPVSITINPNLAKENKTQLLLKLSHFCFFTME